MNGDCIMKTCSLPLSILIILLFTPLAAYATRGPEDKGLIFGTIFLLVIFTGIIVGIVLLIRFIVKKCGKK